ncbi:MAG: hypothetical protein AMQ22_01765 [Candidatus Methanofastidiosum methylothiophilum]|uniref:Uncharacterized protein n=1 Tax=Candidatus Methanofastidiosum methylothiophilum TaxID=1705564 RepID=A0A150IVJ5_9EURY|nr:MAG: hypothetical protein AMQ22_01765 [Candidatus Methanofastidiosum methylthiophilus]
MFSDIFNILVILQVSGSFLGMLGSYLNKNIRMEYKINGFISWLISNTILLIWSFAIGAYWISAMYIFFTYTAIDGLRSHTTLIKNDKDVKFDPPV